MDAVEFIKARDRMMRVKGQAPNVEYGRRRSAEEVVPIVEQWAKEHPIKTRQSELLKMFPKARLDTSGVLRICPSEMIDGCRYKERNACPYDDCRREFWLQEVDE